MASPTTIQMSKLFENFKILHLEVTDVCQAACPLCLREIDTTFNKQAQHHLSMDHILEILDEKTIANLDKMFMCGNYGDPAAGQNTLDIYYKFRKLNPNITLGMNTNGAIRQTDWWTELARILNQTKDYVVFSIDGLEDTNHIYRKNVSWNKLMENIHAFIKAGGNAHWDMLIYNHNKHQVDQCESLARQLGFKWFRAKVSKRSIKNLSWLQPPKGWENPVVGTGSIDCIADQEQSLYISAQAVLFKCCWLGVNEDWNLNNFETIQKTWGTDNCNIQCKRTCTTYQLKNSFHNQWQRSIDLTL